MKRFMTKRLAALGLSAAAALSGGYLIAPWEGKRNEVYLDVVGVPTVCYGQTGRDHYGRAITLGMKYTDDECTIMLANSIPAYEREVERYTKVPFASTYQKAGMISFTYALGGGAYQKSTMLRDLNRGDHESACNRLLDWKYAGGKVYQGLLNRRKEELSWCTGEVPYEVVATHSEIINWVTETYDLSKGKPKE